jgi:hypothetical protein
MDVLTEADMAATPGVYWGIFVTGLAIGIFILGRSLTKRLKNLNDRDQSAE